MRRPTLISTAGEKEDYSVMLDDARKTIAAAVRKPAEYRCRRSWRTGWLNMTDTEGSDEREILG
jgi:hypothetical protein